MWRAPSIERKQSLLSFKGSYELLKKLVLFFLKRDLVRIQNLVFQVSGNMKKVVKLHSSHKRSPLLHHFLYGQGRQQKRKGFPKCAVRGPR